MVSEFHYNDNLGDVDDLLALLLPDPNTLPETAVKQQRANLLGDFLDARLANLGWSADDLAQKMGCESEYVQDILSGALPESELSDALIGEVAQAVNYEPNVLRIMLGREITPYQPQAASAESGDKASNDEDYDEKIERLLDELTKVLFQGVEELFSTGSKGGRFKQRDLLLRQIEMIISNHRADVKLVQILIEELKTAEVSDGGDPHRLDIRRIIRYIQETR
jgi:hypothetical protein